MLYAVCISTTAVVVSHRHVHTGSQPASQPASPHWHDSTDNMVHSVGAATMRVGLLAGLCLSFQAASSTQPGGASQEMIHGQGCEKKLDKYCFGWRTQPRDACIACRLAAK